MNTVNIIPKEETKDIVILSTYCKLDSNVNTGGGTDETETIQMILDKAKEWGSIYLIVDGAALISGIEIHSNTTIECVSSDCGFYLKNDSNRDIIRNADISSAEIKNENIVLKGGVYNQNCVNQQRKIKEGMGLPKGLVGVDYDHAIRIFGVKNFRMENVTIRDNKVYALLMGNWENVYMENIHIDIVNLVDGTNQDGLHFYGPGKNLVIKNCRGRSGDDLIGLNTDEGDCISSISDVLIDGLILEDSYQAVRLLARERGTLQNVTIRNVKGTIRAFGFYINPWYTGSQISSDFDGTSGTFKNILIENVCIKQKDNPYNYNEPFGFCLGGTIEDITLKNISLESSEEEFRALTVREGHGRLSHKYGFALSPTHIKNLTVKGLKITDKGNGKTKKRWIEHEGKTTVCNFELTDVTAESSFDTDTLICLEEGSEIKNLTTDNISLKGFSKLI